MAVTRWRALEEYHPAVRLMVRYMWRQEPPLLPSGFADQMGLSRQLVSRWLQISQVSTQTAETHTTDRDVLNTTEHAANVAAALPSLTPPLAVRLARAMDLAPHEFLTAAGMCTDEDPLLTIEDAWAYVVARVTVRLNQHAGEDLDAAQGEGRGIRQAIEQMIEDARGADLADLAERQVGEPKPSSKDNDSDV